MVVDDQGRPIHVRIRRRRRELDMPAVELARLAGISPAYVSLIEKGEKVPSEKVALRIAAALGDEADLYLAWSHSRRHGDLSTTRDSLQRLHRYSSQGRARREIRAISKGLRRAADDEDPLLLERPLMCSMAAEPAAAPEWAEEGPVLAVPLLEAGADPARALTEGRGVVDLIRLDRRMLAEDRQAGELFALRPGDEAVRWVRSLIRPDDLVVLTTGVGKVRPGRIYAVRLGRGRPRKRAGLVLSRLLVKGKTLLLVPSEGETDIEVVELGPGEKPRDRIAGEVVATVRRW